MQRVKAVVEYDGTQYCGWQIQKNGKTIQGEIEKALQIILKEKISIIAAGRTDSGVHARNQVFHADIPTVNLKELLHSLNGLLSRDIVIKKIDHIHYDFHARYDAVKRRYKYYISLNPTALNRNFSWQIKFPVNLTLMQQAAQRLCRFREFKTFCKSGSDVRHYRCEIYNSCFYREKDLLVYEVAANRFLYGMVRAIVGLLVDVGRGVVPQQSLDEIVYAGDRSRLLTTAPAKGLVLEDIIYAR